MRYVRAIGLASALLMMTGPALTFAKADDLDDRLTALESENATLKKQIRLQALEKENAKLRKQLNNETRINQPATVQLASADSTVDVFKSFSHATNNHRSRSVYKAPQAPVVHPVLSWTGIYLGIGGGAGWGAKEYSFNQDAALAATLLPYFGTNSPPLNSGATQGSHPISGGFFGGQIGGSVQAGWAVFGIQADAYWADIDGHGSCFDNGAFLFSNATFNCDDRVRAFGSVAGRIGAAVERALIYVRGGWAWESNKQDLTVAGIQYALFDPNASMTGSSVSQTHSGWTVGVGLEYAFLPNWSAFVEYDYFDFGTEDINSIHTLISPRIAALFPNAAATYAVPINTTVIERFNVVKAGINYRINWLNPPLVASY